MPWAPVGGAISGGSGARPCGPRGLARLQVRGAGREDGWGKEVHFVKMEGLGNDYVYVDLWRERAPADPAALSRRISDRRRGVGSDGLILIAPPTSPEARARMIMFNADGSEGEMCGNGIRCVARYLREHGRVHEDTFLIETGAGLKQVQVLGGRVRVDMGPPAFTGASLPADAPWVDRPLTLENGARVLATAVSMGNPHLVLFGLTVTDEVAAELGPPLERHPAFPNRVNVEFAQVLDPARIRMEVYERGSGVTEACGTGACATLVAAQRTGRIRGPAEVVLRGGNLLVRWDEGGSVFMEGDAREVFEGEWRE